MVHRDLKPANVMMLDGEPVVIDFGIAQAGDSTRLTMTGMFMGTPGYLAPEVIEGNPSGPAADVHSWAATLAFAATGRPPFGSGTFEAIFFRIINGQPDLGLMPRPLMPLILHALARDPARRPSAAELAERAAVTGPGGAAAGRAADDPAARRAALGDVGDMRAPPVLAGSPGGANGAGGPDGSGGLAAGLAGSGSPVVLLLLVVQGLPLRLDCLVWRTVLVRLAEPEWLVAAPGSRAAGPPRPTGPG